MAKSKSDTTRQDRAIERKGGYEPGPKTTAELAPPPKGPAPGAKPSNSGGNPPPK
jgi:hypothetical protein